MLGLLLSLTSLAGADIPVATTVPLANGNGLVAGCPGLPPTIAAERGPRAKVRKLNDLPSARAYAAMLRGDLNCAMPLTHPAPAAVRRR